MTTTRDLLRSALLGRTKSPKSLMITEGDAVFEVRQPSVGKRSRIFKIAGMTTTEKGQKAKGEREAKADSTIVDLARLQMQGIFECVYVPGTDENVFGPADRAALEEQECGGLFDKLADAVMEFMNVDADPEDAAKK